MNADKHTGKQSQASMVLMDPACKFALMLAWPFEAPCLLQADIVDSYNGTSDLQLERLNVYFNEVSNNNDSQHTVSC